MISGPTHQDNDSIFGDLYDWYERNFTETTRCDLEDIAFSSLLTGTYAAVSYGYTAYSAGASALTAAQAGVFVAGAAFGKALLISLIAAIVIKKFIVPCFNKQAVAQPAPAEGAEGTAEAEEVDTTRPEYYSASNRFARITLNFLVSKALVNIFISYVDVTQVVRENAAAAIAAANVAKAASDAKIKELGKLIQTAANSAKPHLDVGQTVTSWFS